jgi:hypothetical protein
LPIGMLFVLKYKLHVISLAFVRQITYVEKI